MFKFDVSDDSNDSTADRTGSAGNECSEPILAIPAKEIHPSRESWELINTKKTKKYVLKNGTVLDCICSSDIEHDIRHTAQNESAVSQALSADSDLLPHVYEGGLKVWECSIDLTEHLSARNVQLKGLKVLELGCGSGLPGLFALKEGAAAVHFQDYNEEVIHRLTVPNVVLNSDEEKLKICRFFSGDWKGLEILLFPSGTEPASADKYDLILTSETIYSQASYKKLHDVMACTLKSDGMVYLAAKTCYFGVGGSTREFEDYVRSQGVFNISVEEEFTNGVQREILKLTLKKVPSVVVK